MKNTRRNIFVSLFIFVLLVEIQGVFASQTFQNSLLKADFNKSSIGGVKLTLYTNKPYSDKIAVNKKNDFEYVILMPETSSSLVSKPSLGTVLDVIKSVDVKTQQYSGNLKGYTKITILTSKATEIASEVKILKPALNESDYKELLSQASKKTNMSVKPQPKTIQTVKKEVIKTTVVAKTTMPTKITKQVSEPLITKKAVSAPVVQKNKAILELPTTSKKAPAQEIVTPKKPVISVKTITHKEKDTVTQVKAVTAPSKLVVAPAAKEVMTNSTNKIVIPAAEVSKEIVGNVKPQIEKPSNKIESPLVEEITPPSKSVGLLQKYKNVIKSNVYYFFGFFVAGFILLLLFVRKNARNFNKQKEIFTQHLTEKPLQENDYTEDITEDMDWQEKFQTYVDKTQPPSENKEIYTESSPENKDLNTLFSNESLSEGSTVEVSEGEASENFYAENVTFEEEVSSQASSQENVFIEESEIPPDYIPHSDEVENLEEIFGNEEIIEETSFSSEESQIENYSQETLYEDSTYTEASSILSELPQKEVEPEDELIKSEYAIDKKKGFYLVNFEDTTALVGYIDDEIFILKRFNEIIYDSIQARLSEKKKHSSNYIARVGDFKALIEVTPGKMNLLIEL